MRPGRKPPDHLPTFVRPPVGSFARRFVLFLDQDARRVSRGDRWLELRNKAFELLACFLRHPERVLSRRELLEEVWGFEFLGDSNVIEVTVSYVRQALEAHGEPRLIHTVRPVGYILRAGNEPPRC